MSDQFLKQECIPPALYHTGGLYPGGSLSRDGLCPGALCLGIGVSVHGGPPPGKRPSEGPETETPSGRNMGPETETPRRNMGPETETLWKEHGTRQRDRSNIIQNPLPQKEHGTRDRDLLEGTWDQAARQK